MKETIIKAVVSVIITAVLGFIIAKVKEIATKQKATDEGLQSLLRADMVRTYEKATEKGYAPLYVRDSFEGCFNAYVALGGNGVISDIHTRLLRLPTEPPQR